MSEAPEDPIIRDIRRWSALPKGKPQWWYDEFVAARDAGDAERCVDLMRAGGWRISPDAAFLYKRHMMFGGESRYINALATRYAEAAARQPPDEARRTMALVRHLRDRQAEECEKEGRPQSPLRPQPSPAP